MKSFVAIGLAALILAAPAVAAEPAITEPSAKDETQIDSLIDAVLTGLKQNKIKPAANAFFMTNPIMRGKTSEMDYFGVGAEGTIGIYGTISDCQLIEKVNRGKWAQSRLYVCQHERFLTRWIFDVIKSSTGWQSANLRYDDKFSLSITQ